MTIHYDPVSCQVWIDPITTADQSGQTLCLDHAERLSPPRGWVVVDRRDAQSHIVANPPRATPVPETHIGPRRPVRRRWGSFEAPTLEFTTDPDREAEPEPEAEGPPAELEEQVEELEELEELEPNELVDDLGELFEPRGRLLSRAFESGGPQRSALTELNDDD